MELGKQNLPRPQILPADSAVISSLTVTENEELLAEQVVAMKHLVEMLISQKQKTQESVTATVATAKALLQLPVQPNGCGIFFFYLQYFFVIFKIFLFFCLGEAKPQDLKPVVIKTDMSNSSLGKLEIALKALQDNLKFTALDSEEKKKERRTEVMNDILKPFYTQKEHELGNISL